MAGGRRSASRAAGFVWRHRTGFSVLLFAAAVAAVPLLVTNPYRLGILNLAAIHAMAVLGLNLFIGYAGQISLGHAAFFGLGAYGSAILTTSQGLGPWSAMAATAAGMAVIGFLLGLPTLRLQGHYLAMATLGFNIVVHAVFVQWDGVTGGPSGLWGVPPLTFMGSPVSGDVRFHYLVWAFVAGALMLALNLVRSGVGRGLAALAQDETAAACLGVDVRRGKVSVFVISAVCASVAGSLYAHYFGYVNPDAFGIFASLDLVTMTVVGGLGSVWGSLLGAWVMTELPHSLSFFEAHKDVAQGLILVLILIFLPQGLVSGLVDAVRSRMARRKALAREGTP